MDGVTMSKANQNAREETKKGIEITKEEAIELNKELTKTTKEILETELTPTEREEVIRQFTDPDVLLNIKKEFDKDHIGDEKEKMFLFSASCSSRLPPRYRFSTALAGYSAEGKTNMQDTIKTHLPVSWYIDLTNVTKACIEDDVHPYDLIFFGEKGANKDIIETVKQLVEDGISSLKKDIRKDMKEARHEKQDRKVGIFSTTEDNSEEQLATRYCVITPTGGLSQYKKVNANTLKTSSDLDEEIDTVERKGKRTWIGKGLDSLKNFDVIHIPYAKLITVNSSTARSQRDLKRFLNLIKTLAWIHQLNRKQGEYRGKRILIASAEDCYNAMEISNEIFSYNIGPEKRLHRILEAYSKLASNTNNVYHHRDRDGVIDESKFESLQWVDRSAIQRELNIKTRDTIKSHIKVLEDRGLVKTSWTGNRSFMALNHNSPTNSPTKYQLITNEKNELYEKISKERYTVINEIGGVVRGSIRWSVSSVDPKKTKLLSLEISPTNFTKNTIKGAQKAIVSDEIRGSKFVGEENKHKTQEETVKKCREYCRKLKKQGNKITYTNLCHQFGTPFIEEMKQRKEILALPGGDYDIPS